MRRVADSILSDSEAIKTAPAFTALSVTTAGEESLEDMYKETLQFASANFP